MARSQLNLFDAPPRLPAGMRYQPDLVAPDEERKLVAFIETLPLKPFEFAEGFLGNRRIVSFGWRYDYQAQRAVPVAPIPPELLPLRRKAAQFARLPEDEFRQALVTEYAPGAGIGWHKDKAMFGEIVGISLLAECTFRLRRKEGTGWERMSFVAASRSAYLLSGPARTQWEHSIPPLDRLRYSVTFRNLAKG
ncbi:MAG TPA: alpha-ketoglutarate-dependent dioxygenase AlkB [Pseudolabrys sp.]|nr:alpha-ketoglutarate-dependent dioxygenase AlkB [Pseudolabrys sp.]